MEINLTEEEIKLIKLLLKQKKTDLEFINYMHKHEEDYLSSYFEKTNKTIDSLFKKLNGEKK